MKKIEWLDDQRIKIDIPKQTKKITGTRFGTILGMNPWNTDFQIWCAVTKTYEKPFYDTIYTRAGKTIEPKQADYIEKHFHRTIVRPTDIYGETPFETTHGDFFRDKSDIFGGMWDYLGIDPVTKKVNTVYEMKTTKRSEDWEYDVPEYYALQAALYAYLLGVDQVVMVASFLQAHDYNRPEDFEPSENNTIVKSFSLSKRYPDFEKKCIEPAKKWWQTYVETGVSPKYDTKKDKEILDVLGTHSLSPDKEIGDYIKEAEDLKKKLDSKHQELKADEKRLKELTNIIKNKAIDDFKEGDTKVTIPGLDYDWAVTKTEKIQIDTDKLDHDHPRLLYKYLMPVYSYRISIKKKEN